MTETAAILIVLLPYLEILASTAGAGAAASDLFATVRRWWLTEPAGVLPGDQAIDWLITSRIGARIFVMLLSVAISMLCSGILAHATGQPIGPALDKALAAIIASQLYHLKDMRGQISVDAVPFTFEPETEEE